MLKPYIHMLRQSFAAYNNVVGDQSAGLIVSNVFNATYKKKLHPPITYLISEPTQNCTETSSSAGRFNLRSLLTGCCFRMQLTNTFGLKHLAFEQCSCSEIE